MLKFIRNLFNLTVRIILLGFVVALVGAYLEPTISSVGVLLGGIGLSIVVTAIVTTMLNYRFQEMIHNAFTIVKQTEKADIKRIYAKRESALVEIRKEAEKSNRRIDVLAIAGTDLFHGGCVLQKEMRNQCQGDANLTVRVLLLDPRSRYAVERSLREEDGQLARPYWESTLCTDILDGLANLERISQYGVEQHKDNFSLTVELYNHSPSVLYVRIDNRIFMETYHMGIPTGQREDVMSKCLGKAVPVIETRVSSDFGQLLKSHFKYHWDRSKSRACRKGSCEELRDSLKSVLWEENFTTTYNDDERLLDLPSFHADQA